MKKIIFLIVILFMSILTIKADSTFYLGEKVPNMYIESINGSNMHNGAPFLLHRSDGALVYCINPFKMMSTTEYYKSYTYNDYIFNLTDEQLNRLNIISYYGYGYNNHTDIKWYGITQFLIYKALGMQEVYFTDVYYGNRVEKYVSEVNELETLVNNYYVLPSFSNQRYEYDPNKSYEIVDSNNILHNYQILESNIEASINNNKLIVNTKENGIYKITFIRRSPIGRNYILYNLDGAQSLLYPGKINDITFTLLIEVNSGSITINKFDSENKVRLEASLNGGVFGIYKNNILIDKIIIDNTNSGIIRNLPLGNYTVREITPSNGYNKDLNTYNVTISKNNKDIVIDSYSKIIEGNLIINKYYLDDDKYKIDQNALFEIYHNDKLIKTIYSTSKEKLEYGTYFIKQISGKKYYNLIDNFNTSILEEKDYIFDFYTDKTDEIKAYEDMLNKREESLNKKEEQLIELEKKLEEEKKDLINLKNEILEKEKELDNEKIMLEDLKNEIEIRLENLNNLEREYKIEKEELEKLKVQINQDFILLEAKKKNLEEKEEELNELKKQLDKLNGNLNNKEHELEELEQNIINTEKEIKIEKEELEKLKVQINRDFVLLEEKEKYLKEQEEKLNELKKQLDKLNASLNKKEHELSELEQNINIKENELIEKEKKLNKLKDKIEQDKNNVLIVEVPDTYKKSYNKFVCIILIFIGSLFIFYSIKKVTSC